MDKKLAELGKFIVEDSLKQLDESERLQRKIQMEFERKRKRLFAFAWILTLTLIVTCIVIIGWISLN